MKTECAPSHQPHSLGHSAERVIQKSKEEAHAYYDLALNFTCFHPANVLYFRNEALSNTPHSRVVELGFIFQRKDHQRIWRYILKPP